MNINSFEKPKVVLNHSFKNFFSIKFLNIYFVCDSTTLKDEATPRLYEDLFKRDYNCRLTDGSSFSNTAI